MKNNLKYLPILFIISFLNINLYAQYGPQFDNRGFEQWTNRVSEPTHWHSAGTADGSYSSFLPDDLIESSTQTRPGSTGSKSVRLVPKEVGFLFWTYTANGNLTNGRMNAGSTSTTGEENYNGTRRNESGFNTPINQLPDSLSIWVCFRSQSSTQNAQVKAVVHGNADYQIRANGTESPSDMHVSTAEQALTRTSANGGAYNWRRLSIPFQNNGPCTDVRYILFSGSTNDDMFVDDVLLIYNPSLNLGQLAANSFSPGDAITIPFTLSGTMSPENLNKAANEVIAQLSDANGNFNNPTELGRVTTNTSGSITAQIPNVTTGNGYRIRVISTNYPMVGGNIQQVSIMPTAFTITATADPTGAGNVTGSGSYNQGETCTLTATANNGYTFVNWTKDGTQVSTNPSYSFTVTESATYIAHFSANSYTIDLTASPTNGGTVTGGGTYNYGQSCTVSATAATGFTFEYWRENGNYVTSQANYTFTVTGDRNLEARFSPQTYSITAHADPVEGGVVTGDGSYHYGETCTLTATANTGYTIVNWTKDGTQVSTNPSYSFTVNETADYVAHFSVNTYTVSVSANPRNGGTVTGGGTYNYGQSCSVHATANTGYTFINWTENGNQVSSQADYTFTVESNRNLVANFSSQSYIITASADPSEGGVVTGSGGYDFGDACTLTAMANTGYTFVNWTKNGTEVSTNPTYSFTVTESATYVAHFTINNYMINAAADPIEGGTVTGAGNYNYGTSCTLTATANENYEFINWTKNGVVVSTDATYTFMVTASEDYVAHFRYFDNVDEDTATCQIFPNPFTSSLSITTENAAQSVSVYDFNGRLLMKQSINDLQFEIDLSQLTHGTYLLQIDYGNSRSVHRIMKAE